VIGQLNMRRFTKMYGDRGINVAVFSDVQPALAWIDPL
jgi:hypothetical protein